MVIGMGSEDFVAPQDIEMC
jgi:hypothetical protein